METSIQLNNSISFLAYATGAIIILVGVMLIKVLYDLSKLTRNINETVTIAKTELEPALKNINKSVAIVSSVIIKTNEGLGKVKTFISRTPLRLLSNLSKLSNKASKGFWTGLSSALKMFSKK